MARKGGYRRDESKMLWQKVNKLKNFKAPRGKSPYSLKIRLLSLAFLGLMLAVFIAVNAK